MKNIFQNVNTFFKGSLTQVFILLFYKSPDVGQGGWGLRGNQAPEPV